MKKIIVISLSIIFISFSFLSCKQKREKAIVLPPSLQNLTQEDWAVIQEPYAAFYEEPDVTSGIAAHARHGDVLQVEGRKIDDNRQIWVKFARGWIQSSVVIIYSNELKARKAASSIKN